MQVSLPLSSLEEPQATLVGPTFRRYHKLDIPNSWWQCYITPSVYTRYAFCALELLPASLKAVTAVLQSLVESLLSYDDIKRTQLHDQIQILGLGW